MPLDPLPESDDEDEFPEAEEDAGITLEARARLGRKVLATGLAPVMSLVFQTLLGFLLGLLFLWLFFPDIYLGFGLLFPLGFSQGPGQAYTIGSQWENLGFPHAATSGLAFATWGMLWGTIPGVFLINVLRKIYKTAPLQQLNKMTTTQQPPETIGPGSLLKLLLHTSGIYMITLLLISLLAFSLSLSGNIGASFAGIIWGLHFLFAVCLAFLFRFTWHRYSPASWHYSSKERCFLGHAGSLTLDIMVVAAIASIDLQQLSATFAPVFLISTIGGFIVLLYSVYLGRQIFREHQVENTVALYGLFTGTMASSSALLRAIDPEDSSGTMSNLAMASGICVLPSLPVIFIANLPIIAISQEIGWLLPLSLVLLAVYYCILHFCLKGILRKMN